MLRVFSSYISFVTLLALSVRTLGNVRKNESCATNHQCCAICDTFCAWRSMVAA